MNGLRFCLRMFPTIDNEAGLLISPGREDGLRLREHHRDLLHSLCVFKRSTVAAVFSLYSSGAAVSQLEQFIERHEPLYQEMVKKLPHWMKRTREELPKRIEEVWLWMKQCQEREGFSNL